MVKSRLLEPLRGRHTDGGHGSFSEPRTGVMVINGTDDLIMTNSGATGFSAVDGAPPAPAGTFDAAAACAGEGIQRRREMLDVSQWN